MIYKSLAIPVLPRKKRQPYDSWWHIQGGPKK